MLNPFALKRSVSAGSPRTGAGSLRRRSVRQRSIRFEALETRDLLATIINLSPVNSTSSYEDVGLINNLVAEFAALVDGVQDRTPGNYSAQIDWGDGGGFVTGKVVLKGSVSSAQFQVKGTHIYDTVGSYDVTVKVSGNGEMDELQSTTHVVRQMPSGLDAIPPPANELDGEQVHLNVGTASGISAFTNVGFELNTIAGLNGFLNGIQNTRLADYVAFVNWGDSSAWDEAEVAPQSSTSQPILIKGSHVYDLSGNYPVVAFVQGPDGTSETLRSTSVNVTNLPNNLTGMPPPDAPRPEQPQDFFINIVTVSSAGTFTGTPLNNRLVGQTNVFRDGNKVTDPNLVHAYINWGDSNEWSEGTIEENSGGSIEFSIFGSHTYTKAGNFRIVVYVTAPDGTSHADDTTSINVSKPPTPLLIGHVARNAVEGKPLKGAAAVFDGDSTSTPLRSLQAKMDWGDGDDPVPAPITLKGGTEKTYQIIPPPKTFDNPGKYKAEVTVTDGRGNESTHETTVHVTSDQTDLAVDVVTDRIVPTLATDLNLNFFFGGESIRTPVNIKNLGSKPANGSATVSVYLSKLPNLGGEKVLLGSKNVALNLAAGATQQVLMSGQVPANLTVGGKYYVIARVTAGGINEETLANNTNRSSRTFEFLGDPKSNRTAFSNKTLFFNFVRRALQNRPDIPATIDRADMTEFISHFEGRRPGPYVDSAQHPSIGIGINLDTVGGSLKVNLLKAVRRFYLDERGRTLSSDDSVVMRMLANQARTAKANGTLAPAALTEADMDALFNQALPIFIAKARNSLTPAVYDALNSYQKVAVASMTYNLGSLVKFPGMVTAFKQGRLLKAGFELVNAIRTTEAEGLRRRTGNEFANFFEGHEDLLGQIVR